MANVLTPVPPSVAPTRGASAGAGVVQLLSVIAAVLSVGGGVVHLAVIRHHLDDTAVTVGFALTGFGQLLLAVGLLALSSTRVRAAGVLLHASIVITWLVSRTVGLAVVPGAEHREPFGLADTVANAFGVCVVVALIAAHLLSSKSDRQELRVGVTPAVTALAVVAVFALTVPAALASHEHGVHDHPVDGQPMPAHDHPPIDEHGAAHDHDHGS